MNTKHNTKHKITIPTTLKNGEVVAGEETEEKGYCACGQKFKSETEEDRGFCEGCI